MAFPQSSVGRFNLPISAFNSQSTYGPSGGIVHTGTQANPNDAIVPFGVFKDVYFVVNGSGNFMGSWYMHGALDWQVMG